MSPRIANFGNSRAQQEPHIHTSAFQETKKHPKTIPWKTIFSMVSSSRHKGHNPWNVGDRTTWHDERPALAQAQSPNTDCYRIVSHCGPTHGLHKSIFVLRSSNTMGSYECQKGQMHSGGPRPIAPAVIPTLSTAGTTSCPRWRDISKLRPLGWAVRRATSPHPALSDAGRGQYKVNHL